MGLGERKELIKSLTLSTTTKSVSGIDDMFVILQSWSNYSEGDKEKDNVYRFGVAMKHAGVAITVTSLTDVLAFIIGATTVRGLVCPVIKRH